MDTLGNGVERYTGIPASDRWKQYVKSAVDTRVTPDPELLTPEWKSFVNNIDEFIDERHLAQELVVWPDASIFIEGYIPPEGALLRGMHDISPEILKRLMTEGIASRILQNSNGDFEEVKRRLEGKDITREFLKHYLGAGKEGDLFWQAHDESPFVGLSLRKDAALWHASQGGGYRVLFELTPLLFENPAAYSTLEKTPRDQKVEGDIAKQKVNIETGQRPTFQHPFIRLAGQEIAFYPKVSAKDISRVHLFPSTLNVPQPSDI